MEEHFLNGTLSLIVLLTISSFTFLLARKINFPYTILLVLVGLILIPLSNIQGLEFINSFQLTPEILFFVFLPVLLFESAYNINYRQLIKNWRTIFSLAVVGLVISTLLIGTGLYYILPLIGFDIPFIVCLIFGALISATDPVAVLSLFKSMGAPRRLALIFEGESLFNDGTALALFLVLLEIARHGGEFTSGTIFGGFISFLSMALGGIIFGAITGVLFSKVLEYIRNNESVEITLTMILAHLTFILAEVMTEYTYIGNFDLQISGVISTAIAGIIIGNYGRYKISPKVEEYMEKFWGFFAFLANSLVFILLGLIVSRIDINLSTFIIPILVVIGIVIIARAISVYLPLNILKLFKREEPIPKNWQHLLAWASLRGALALMMVLMIPESLTLPGWNFEFSVKEFLLVITIGSIMFTLFIKATTISPLMKKMKVDKLHDLEKFEYDEGKILSIFKMLNKLHNSYKKNYLTKDEYEELKNKYENKLSDATNDLKELINTKKDKTYNLIKRAISLHALGIEKQYLKGLFSYNEIDEKNFKFVLHKINRQIERLENSQPQIRKGDSNNCIDSSNKENSNLDQVRNCFPQIKNLEEKDDYDIFEKFERLFRNNKDNPIDKYIRNRTRVIITRKVIKELNQLKEIDFGFDKSVFDEVIGLYRNFNNIAEEKKGKIFNEHKLTINNIEAKLVDKSLIKLEEQVIDDLFNKEVITPKLYFKFKEEIEEEIYSDFKKITT